MNKELIHVRLNVHAELKPWAKAEIDCPEAAYRVSPPRGGGRINLEQSDLLITFTVTLGV